MGRLVKYDINTVQQDAKRYSAANPFLNQLRKYQNHLDRQQFKTLRGQALSGDIAGAEKGLAKLIGWRIT